MDNISLKIHAYDYPISLRKQVATFLFLNGKCAIALMND